MFIIGEIGPEVCGEKKFSVLALQSFHKSETILK